MSRRIRKVRRRVVDTLPAERSSPETGQHVDVSNWKGEMRTIDLNHTKNTEKMNQQLSDDNNSDEFNDAQSSKSAVCVAPGLVALCRRGTVLLFWYSPNDGCGLERKERTASYRQLTLESSKAMNNFIQNN